MTASACDKSGMAYLSNVLSLKGITTDTCCGQAVASSVFKFSDPTMRDFLTEVS